jgi:hypothetical protein
VAAAALNFNVVTLKTEELLGLEVCACLDSFILAAAAGAAMTTKKAATVDLLGLLLVACLVVVITKSMVLNLNVTNGMIFTACAAAAVKATDLTMYLAIVTVAIGTKVTGWH